jgi:hypothetical protein
MEIKNVKVTNFGKRHFDPKFGGTKITDMSVEDFELWINNQINDSQNASIKDILGSDLESVIPGYADFCKLVCLKNRTSARTGSLPITIGNYQYLRSGFSSRTPSELAVMDRWFELPLRAPKAEYLMVVLYSKEQIDKESEAEIEKNGAGGWVDPVDFEGEWGVVAILGQMQSEEEPMKPITMMRNALGITEGGSGVAIDRERYKRSVEFWSNNATVK